MLAALQDDYNAAHGTVGWVYRDIPRMSPPIWEKILTIMGTGNYVILVESSGRGHASQKEDGGWIWEGDEEWHRGQLMVSPEGEANLKAWAHEHENQNKS